MANVDSLNIQISASATKASNALSKMSGQLDKLDSSLDSISNGGMKNLTNNVNSLSGAMKNLKGVGSFSSSLSRVSNSSVSAGSSLSRLTSSLKNLIPFVGKADKTSKGFVSTIGMFYAKFFLVVRAIKMFGRAVGSAQDYIEDFNYFTVALQKVGQDSKKQFKENGYSDADSYAESFRTRFTKLQKQMTGYTVDKDTGELATNMNKSLGLNISEVMQYQAALVQITNSAGMLGETSIATAKALSMLSADWSSLTNQDLSTVQNNLQSALIGQSRAVYKYGIDITNAGLAQTAFSHGIKVSIKDLDQQSKQQLRVLTLLEKSKVAYGDLGKTLNQPANQLRMMRAEISNLGRAFGNLFIPLVAKIYPYINAFIKVLKNFIDWITKALGIKPLDTSNFKAPEFKTPAKDAGKMAKATKDTAKASKKISDNLQSFDIINKLSADNNDSGNGGNSNTPSTTSIDLSNEIDKALKGYEDAWNDAIRKAEDKSNQLAEKIKKGILDGWRKGGDYTTLGKKLADWINKGLSNIPWKQINSNTKKMARSISSFLNGAINELDWKLVGESIGKGINTGLSFVHTFFSTFDFLSLGTSLATLINNAIKSTNFRLIGATIGEYLRGAVQFAFGFVKNMDFTSLGRQLGLAINKFFSTMGRVDARTGLTGWQELGQSISKSITGVADMLIKALDTVNWDSVGQAIGQFLGSIKWGDIFNKLGTVLVKALFASVKTAISAFKTDPVGVTQSFIAILGSYFAITKLMSIKTLIVTGVGNVISQGLSRVLSSGAITSSIGSLASGLFTKIGVAFSTAGTFIAGLATKIGSVISLAISKVVVAAGAVKTLAMSLFASLKTAIASVGVGTLGIGAVLVGAIAGETYLLTKLMKDGIDAVYGKDTKQEVTRQTQMAIDSITSKYKGMSKAIQNTTKDVININKQITKTNGSEIDALANDYMKLSKKTNPTASDIAVMKKYSEQLNNMIPGFSANVDKQTGAFKGSSEELAALTSSYKKTLKAQVAYESSLQLYKDKKEQEKENKKAKDAVDEAYEKFINARKRLDELRKQGKDVDDPVYQQQLKQVGSLADAYNKARGEWDKGKKALSELNKQINANNNIMDYANVSAKKFEKAESKLNDSMSKLNVPTRTQKDVLSKLKKELENGNISWKKYKEITSESYKSTDDLNKKIKESTGLEINVAVNGADQVQNMSNTVSSIPSEKNVSVTATVQAPNFDDRGFAKNVQSKLDGKVFTFGVKPKLKDNFKKVMEDVIGTKPYVIPMKVAVDKKTVNALSDFLKNGGLFNPNNAKKILNGLNGLPTYSGKYATGGFPEDGWFRASKGEMMGKWDNGNNVVANNNQITNGIANAVYPAMYSAIQDASANFNGGSGDFNIYLNGKQITDVVVEDINNRTQRRGRSPLHAF